jgi:hypothetical protein
MEGFCWYSVQFVVVGDMGDKVVCCMIVNLLNRYVKYLHSDKWHYEVIL